MAGLKSFHDFATLVAFSAIFFASSCKKDVVKDMDGETLPKKIGLDIPSNFPKATDDPDNPLTEQGVALGRLLFYDTRLSGSNKLSCASCHRQELAFSDGVARSNIGESGQPLPRHAPALINLAWAKSGLFWDGGSTNLESQAFGPLTSEDEMHQNLSELEDELKAIPDYVKRFKDAFGTGVKSASIVKALAQFERTLISANSRYDKYIRKENGAALTDAEIRGMALVNTKCRSCHSGELFTDDGYHNNGIDSDFSNASLDGLFQGRSRITYNLLDLGKFKTPTLRNVSLTAPYMHDGRIKTLKDVLEHYNKGIQVSPTTDVLLFQNNGEAGIPLSLQDKSDIIAFLNTLTDEQFVRNTKFNKPNLP
ncbi:cytochrome-c peroxidase [Pedobacter zeae]|uniref:Methylamine utilization protein MauG n=2 Tax=Pedobacter zeae TaxID=1737356 RepID=A0A7W6KDJ9_9SPHI|nr:cytochrome c peroxidase [Pedobacter zeae]MBB4109647.1 cytochrome c peroxidase [Pedobacter zeae]